jgi:hypothetical protein
MEFPYLSMLLLIPTKTTDCISLHSLTTHESPCPYISSSVNRSNVLIFTNLDINLTLWGARELKFNYGFNTYTAISRQRIVR